MRRTFTLRIRLIAIFVVLFGLLLITRLYFVEVVNGEVYVERANRQYARPNQDLYDRGSIYFTTKDGSIVSAATLASGFTVAIDPELITDPEDVYEKISAIIPLDHDTFMAHAMKTDDPYEEIADQVSSDDGKKIDALHIPGVDIYDERWRYYPGNSLAARAIGFVGYKGNTLTGITGLELYYNDLLARDTSSVDINFFAQVFSTLGSAVFDSGKRGQGDLVTTIEPSVEQYLEQMLKSVDDEYHPSLTGGIIMDPKTGAIYAMGAYPTFDLNNFGDVTDPGLFANPIVESRYEMGSIIKPLTMAAGIDSGAVEEDTTYDDTGCINVDTKRICNYDFRARGVIPMQQILSQSLNVGASFVATKMGPTTMRHYFVDEYKLGDATGIDLPGEIHGDVHNLDSPRQVEYDTASFGQGIALTPIETIRALGVLANGGVMVNPHIGKTINYQTGITTPATPAVEGTRAISAQTAKTVTDMLVTVFDDALLNGKAKNPHYTMAAKTGTAQIANPAGGGYYADRYLHSFFGYFPAYDPRFIVFLYTVYPKNIEYASETLTHPFLNISKFLINYYNIPPDR
jgi:cell division protein FtsI (penicillin-binding protein 3)/stage V sporulation protein D (sporulation-specific penicillin-binding protein)